MLRFSLRDSAEHVSPCIAHARECMQKDPVSGVNYWLRAIIARGSGGVHDRTWRSCEIDRLGKRRGRIEAAITAINFHRRFWHKIS